MHSFERELCVFIENTEFSFDAHGTIPWADLWLNPRRLRGSDFLMRWSQGVWSEKRIVQAIGETESYFALPYGPSGVAPEDPKEFEQYFERLDRAGMGKIKRPDLLLFPKSREPNIRERIEAIGGLQELPFTPEDDRNLTELLSQAILAVECENSLWKAKAMPDYGSPLKPQRRLGGKPGLKKTAVVPTVILKEEDCGPLVEWQARAGIAVHIWQVFFDLAIGLSLDRGLELIANDSIQPVTQIFQAPGGATTRKTIYKFYYHYAYSVGEVRESPTLVADYVEDKNGHILPYVRFQDGRFTLDAEALNILDVLYQGVQE